VVKHILDCPWIAIGAGRLLYQFKNMFLTVVTPLGQWSELASGTFSRNLYICSESRNEVEAKRAAKDKRAQIYRLGVSTTELLF